MQNQSANNKRIAKNTLLLYVRMLFGMLVSLYTSRVILSTLGVEDYGVYNVVGGVITMFSFVNGAMSSATCRYITFESGKGTYTDKGCGECTWGDCLRNYLCAEAFDNRKK